MEVLPDFVEDPNPTDKTPAIMRSTSVWAYIIDGGFIGMWSAFLGLIFSIVLSLGKTVIEDGLDVSISVGMLKSLGYFLVKVMPIYFVVPLIVVGIPGWVAGAIAGAALYWYERKRQITFRFWAKVHAVLRKVKKPIWALTWILIILFLIENFIPLADTGQACYDMLSGHVPLEAERMYHDKVFTTIENNPAQLADLIRNETDRAELAKLTGIARGEYEIIGGDDMNGYYEDRIRFSNGRVIRLSYFSQWPCPDFEVTEEEVFDRIKDVKVEILE